MTTTPLTLAQRLLAEAVRLHEDGQGFADDEPLADAKARASGGDLEHRIAVRAQALSMAPALETALHQLRGASSVVVIVGLILALVAGATASQVVFGSQLNGPVNFFWVLGSLLGVHTFALLLWLAMISIRSGDMATGLLGGMVLGVGRRISRWLHKGPVHVAAVQASASMLAHGAIGRWTLSAISHALWLAFLIGCLVLVLLILSTKQYTFAWETTILSDQTYVTLTRGLAAIPAILGFAVPDPQQIMDSHWIGSGEPPVASREAWAGLLVGCLVVYGLLPRGLLLVISLVAQGRARKRFRLDTSLPGYARLEARLMPVAQSLGVVDAEAIHGSGSVAEPIDQERPLAIRESGPTAILGLEIEPPTSGWPPAAMEWLDLGFVDNRSDRHRVLERLDSAIPPPRLIVVVCSLAATPDRGSRAFIHDLQQASGTPVAMVLTDGQRLRERGHGEQVEQRVEDWRRLAADAQVAHDRIVEVDLNHLTDASRNKLARLTGAASAVGVPVRRIEESFHLIVDHAQRWSGQPGLAEQAELQRAIAGLYRNQSQSWQDFLRTGLDEGPHQVQQIKTSAERMVALLPGRLRKSPKWLAAGAMAGALGCIAAATLVAPVAIASLPAWAGLGAAVSAALRPADGSPPAAESPGDLSEAVGSAALFALVLELQGRDETAITRIIDKAIGGDDPPVIDTIDAARVWLDTLRHRLDRTLAEENAI